MNQGVSLTIGKAISCSIVVVVTEDKRQFKVVDQLTFFVTIMFVQMC